MENDIAITTEKVRVRTLSSYRRTYDRTSYIAWFCFVALCVKDVQNKLTTREAQLVEERLLAEEKRKKVMEEKRELIEAVAAAAVGQKEKDLQKMVGEKGILFIKLHMLALYHLMYSMMPHSSTVGKGQGR